MAKVKRITYDRDEGFRIAAEVLDRIGDLDRCHVPTFVFGIQIAAVLIAKVADGRLESILDALVEAQTMAGDAVFEEIFDRERPARCDS